MADERANRIIALQQREEMKASNFRNLYQETADLMMPRENQITTKKTPGEDKTKEIYDPTAILDSQDMASGLSAAFIPSGQKFFGLIPKNKALKDNDRVQKYLAMATEITHDELFESNFMLHFNETLRTLVVLGTGCLYSEWDSRNLGLNFKDWDISLYTIKQDFRGNVDTLILKYPLTARQAVDEFGDKVGSDVLKAVEKLESESTLFEFIHLIRPRIKRNVMLVDNLNMPWESVYVNVKEKIVVEEGGYEELPGPVARWMKSSFEKYGRGQGTECLSSVKELQTMHRDFVECGNKWNNPPLEVKDTFEGQVRVTPGAQNSVRDVNSIKAIQGNALGNFPITKEMLLFQQEIIHKAFFVDVFAPLANLPGDRRTTVEIYARFEQAAKKLAMPLYRLQSELLTPTITRCVLLLIRNGRIPYPPPELQGEEFGIEYLSELALALRNQQAVAFQKWATFTAQMDGIFPEEKPSDNINPDKATRRMGRAFGVAEEDLATEDEVAAKRTTRTQRMAQQQALQTASVAAEGYGKTTQAPETGSVAEKVMAGVGA